MESREQSANNPAVVMNRDAPLVSVITVVYNNVKEIEETMQSVLDNIQDAEYIVIDGGSTDGTVDVIKKFESRLSYWITERDGGIYDAINKGIKASRGHFFYVVNCGDKVLSWPINQLRRARELNADVAMFRVSLSNGQVFRSYVGQMLRVRNTIHHQGAFFRRSLNITYDVQFRIFADFDINQKLFLARRKFIEYPDIICRHSLEGISQKRTNFGELLEVVRTNFGVVWMASSWVYFRIRGLSNRIFSVFTTSTSAKK